MRLLFTLGESSFRALTPGHDLSIAMQFDGPQPNTYDVPDAGARPYEGGGFVGDVRRGGPCNFETYTLTPHCNGTHTECVGHITAERLSVRDFAPLSPVPASLVTVPLRRRSEVPERYASQADDADWLVTCAELAPLIDATDPRFRGALILRTDAFQEAKPAMRWQPESTPYLSNEAMEYIRDAGFVHLLLDLPSVDRLYDQGKLSNHHIFWGMEAGSTDSPGDPYRQKTITEMIYVPDSVKDGRYLLDLQIAPFHSDAAPSRPLVYPVIDYS